MILDDVKKVLADAVSAHAEAVSKIRGVNTDAKERCEDYKAIRRNPLVRLAVDLLANEAMQPNPVTFKRVWVSGEDATVAEYLTQKLDEKFGFYLQFLVDQVCLNGLALFRVNRDSRGKIINFFPILDLEKYSLIQFEDEDKIHVMGEKDGKKYLLDDNKVVVFVNLSVVNSQVTVVDISEGENTVERKVIIYREEAIVGENIREVHRILR